MTNRNLPAKQPRRITSPWEIFKRYEEGRLRSMKYDVNALADFEQETGMGFAELFSKRAVFAAARALIWAGLKHEDRTLSIERVGVLISHYLRDESVARGEHTVDNILQAALKCAVEQGALGRTAEESVPATDQETDPNEEAGLLDEEGLKRVN